MRLGNLLLILSLFTSLAGAQTDQTPTTKDADEPKIQDNSFLEIGRASCRERV